MATVSKLANHLKDLLKLLKEEKEALIHNDGEKIAELVETKNNYIEKLGEFKGLDMEKNEEIIALSKEIDSLQEINLLMTKQALSYQNAILESIAKNVQTKNTYSSKGNYDSKDVNIIDQSI